MINPGWRLNFEIVRVSLTLPNDLQPTFRIRAAVLKSTRRKYKHGGAMWVHALIDFFNNLGRPKYYRMNLPHYNYLTSDFQAYEFYSEGPKGRIKKVVTFSRIQDEPPIYNLTLVDVDPVSGLASDLTVSDNGDRNIILATVAYTVKDFSAHYGGHFIYAKGSTAVRTRLYQMSIARLFEEISIDFDVYGVIKDIAYPFQKNVNYDAFLVKRK